MTVMQHPAKAAVSKVMYIRGVPFYYSEAAPKEPVTVPASSTTARVDGTTRGATGQGQPVNTVFGTSQTKLRSTTAGARQAGISRSETEAQARLMENRRGVRVFSGEAVPMRRLRELISVASRPADEAQSKVKAHFIMIESQPSMDRVMRMAVDWLLGEGLLADGAEAIEDVRKGVFGGAPHMAVAYGRRDSSEAADACARAVARLEWLAASAGLGTCFAGEIVRAAARSTPLSAALSVPDGQAAYGALLLGYPGFSDADVTSVPGARIIWL